MWPLRLSLVKESAAGVKTEKDLQREQVYMHTHTQKKILLLFRGTRIKAPNFYPKLVHYTNLFDIYIFILSLCVFPAR